MQMTLMTKAFGDFRVPALGVQWREAYEVAESTGLFQRLNQVYALVPSGHCSGCTACCSESVSTFFIEWLQIRKVLEDSGRWSEALQRAEAYGLNELARPMKCPMLEPDGRCMIYEARPLTCRIFGHLKAGDYTRNLKAVLKANRQVAQTIERQFGVVLPISVVERSIPFCESFVSESPMSSRARDALFDDLFGLDSRFFAKGLLEPDQIQLGLVDWFTMVRLDPEKMAQERLSRVRALVQDK
jgi:Fe-S-cluster containining protein